MVSLSQFSSRGQVWADSFAHIILVSLIYDGHVGLD